MRGIQQLAWTAHSSILPLLSRYDGFILDQFGVLHNGREALPGAIDCVHALVARNKNVVILSNTSASSKSCLQKLKTLGFDGVDNAVTSGEEASRYIRNKYGSSATTTKRAIWLTYEQDKGNSKLNPSPLDFLSQCGNIELCDSVDGADFIIAHGSQIWLQSNNKQLFLGSFMQDGNMDVVGPLLQECALHNLPMVCANPDFVVKLANDEMAYMPGILAKHFHLDLHGNVVSFGKPNVEHFHACLQAMDLPSHRVVHVGDSLHHDIAGANAAGIDSIFVTSAGVHSHDLDVSFGDMADTDKLNQLFQSEGITPTHVVPSFQL
jgi:HAD superfamily hydrolase (TIGR01459 family)